MGGGRSASPQSRMQAPLLTCYVASFQEKVGHVILRDVNTVQNASYMKIKYLKQAKQKKAEKQRSKETGKTEKQKSREAKKQEKQKSREAGKAEKQRNRKVRVLHLAFTFIQARGRCTTPPSLAPSPLKLGGAAPPPPPAFLVSSSCTTHHPYLKSLDIHHPQLTFRPWEMHHPPPLFPFHGGGCTTPPQLCPSKVGGVHHPPHLHPFKGRDLLSTSKLIRERKSRLLEEYSKLHEE